MLAIYAASSRTVFQTYNVRTYIHRTIFVQLNNLTQQYVEETNRDNVSLVNQERQCDSTVSSLTWGRYRYQSLARSAHIFDGLKSQNISAYTPSVALVKL